MTVHARALGLVSLLLAGAACGSDNGAAARAAPGGARRFKPLPVEGGCPDEDPTLWVDLNRDGTRDLVVIPEGSGTCRAADLNFDGTFDLYRHRDGSGNIVREEADLDYDRRLDVVAYQAGGSVTREEFDTNWDGAVDLWVVLDQPCEFQGAPPQTCVTTCGVPWCMPRARQTERTEEEAAPREEHPAERRPVTLLYRDANADGLWDTAEVLWGDHPICVGLNRNLAGDTPDRVHPDEVEVYLPRAAVSGQAHIDYVKRDYLDLEGNPIIRCEGADGLVTECPSVCGR